MGNPILRKKAQSVSKDFVLSKNFKILVEDLRDSMKHYGGIGIAAPQIGIDFSVAIIEIQSINRYGQEVNLPFTVFVNPKITFLTDDLQGFWEGCLSVPGLRGYVERPKKIKVEFINGKGEEQEIVAEGFLSTVIQHELDHLDGILYIDRIKNSHYLSYQEEFDEYISEKRLE